jgi:hypothetical protein
MATPSRPFARSFAVGDLAAWSARNPGNAIQALFDLWCLPGEVSLADGPSLRLGLRDRYLNFYANGQSVGKLSFSGRLPKLAVHQAYLHGGRRDRTDTTEAVEGEYKAFDAGALATAATASLVSGWIETAKTYASAEKCFVDELIAANAGVIDLEMGLPANELENGKRAAPRMDLVIAQQYEDEQLSIAFWEAKCANNTELRAKAPRPPHVLKQIDTYIQWMGHEGRVAQVGQAYRTAASTLVELHQAFRNSSSSVPECVGIWRKLADLEQPEVTVRPGIVVGNYWPTSYQAQIASGRMRQSAESFARNNHRACIEDAGISLHEVGPDHGELRLPYLASR